MSEAFRRWFPPLFYTAAAAFLILYLSSIDYSSLSRLSLNWRLLFTSSLVAMAFRYWGVIVWRVILMELGTTTLPGFNAMAAVYAKAWMGRYIPGKVAWIVGKVYLAAAFGISKSRLAVSSLLEGGMQIVAILAVALLLLGMDTRLDVIPRLPKLLLLAGGACCLVALHPAVFNRLVRRTYTLVRREEPGPELTINNRAAFKSFVLYSIGAIISGSSFYLLATAVDPAIEPDMYLYFVGAYTLAGAIGMATPLLPSGIGVRDGVLLGLLTIALPAEIAVALTVLSRLWSAVIDVLFYAVAAIAPRLFAFR